MAHVTPMEVKDFFEMNKQTKKSTNKNKHFECMHVCSQSHQPNSPVDNNGFPAKIKMRRVIPQVKSANAKVQDWDFEKYGLSAALAEHVV